MNMEMFDIGNRISGVNRKNEAVEMGEYRLHVQAPWRIVKANRIAVGSIDARWPITDADSEFDPDRDRSLCEHKMRSLLDEHRSQPLVIKSVFVHDVGGFQLRLSDGYVLEVIPASSREDYEHWRLIGPGANLLPISPSKAVRFFEKQPINRFGRDGVALCRESRSSKARKSTDTLDSKWVRAL
jgi:hypothetical protein